MKIDIINIVDLVRNNDWFGGGDAIEIAKGKYQVDNSWAGFKRKLRRALKWQ